jgi:hypothetical protein
MYSSTPSVSESIIMCFSASRDRLKSYARHSSTVGMYHRNVHTSALLDIQFFIDKEEPLLGWCLFTLYIQKHKKDVDKNRPKASTEEKNALKIDLRPFLTGGNTSETTVSTKIRDDYSPNCCTGIIYTCFCVLVESEVLMPIQRIYRFRTES